MNEIIKKRAVHRSRIIEGQMRGLQKMIEDDAYCMNILTQSLAIQRSLSSLNKLVLENHLQTHIKEMLSSSDEIKQEKAVEEMLHLYELHNVRSKNT
jgi:DNA-binding FrmR family transcriptional regulator